MRKKIGKINSPKKKRQMRRKLSIRNKISGTSDVPRICVLKTNKHLRVLVVDDSLNKILFSKQTFGKNACISTNELSSTSVLGEQVANEMKSKGVKKAVFDRNGNRYFGKITVLADSIREHGILF